MLILLAVKAREEALLDPAAAMQKLRRAPEVQLLRHRNEVAQLSQLDGASTS